MESKEDGGGLRQRSNKTKRPANTPFRQQRLKAWQPILTPKWVIGVFTLIGIVFLPLGIGLLTASNDVVEARCQYDGAVPASGNPEGCPDVASLPAACRVTDGTRWNAEQHYWNLPAPRFMNRTGPGGSSGRCNLTMTVPATPPGKTVYVYYELTNFYQNHRRYVKSRNDPQLRGDKVTSSLPRPSKLNSSCAPLSFFAARNESVDRGDLDFQPTYYWPGGLIANSFFNDQFEVVGYDMNETDIAWKTDREQKFSNPFFCKHDKCQPPGGAAYSDESDGRETYEAIAAHCGHPRTTSLADLKRCFGLRWKPRWIPEGAISSFKTADCGDTDGVPDTTKCDRYNARYLWEEYPQLYEHGVKNEHLIAWMRTAGLPTFRKLYGRIVPQSASEAVFSAATPVTVLIDSRFMVASYDGTKSIVFATTSWLGGKNTFLAYAYVVTGAVCLFLAIVFGIKHLVSPREMGDPKYLKWKQKGGQ